MWAKLKPGRTRVSLGVSFHDDDDNVVVPDDFQQQVDGLSKAIANLIDVQTGSPAYYRLIVEATDAIRNLTDAARLGGCVMPMPSVQSELSALPLN